MSGPDDGLRALLRRELPRVHWTSVETGLTQGGVPDLHGCWAGADLWLECKSVRRGWAVHLRAAQVAWHLGRARRGGRSWILVRRRLAAGAGGGGAADELWAIAGWASRELLDRGLPPAACPTPGAPVPRGRPASLPAGALLGAWAGGPARWPLAALLDALARR